MLIFLTVIQDSESWRVNVCVVQQFLLTINLINLVYLICCSNICKNNQINRTLMLMKCIKNVVCQALIRFTFFSAWITEEKSRVGVISIASFCRNISAFTPEFNRGLTGVCVSHSPGNVQYQIQRWARAPHLPHHSNTCSGAISVLLSLFQRPLIPDFSVTC